MKRLPALWFLSGLTLLFLAGLGLGAVFTAGYSGTVAQPVYSEGTPTPPSFVGGAIGATIPAQSIANISNSRRTPTVVAAYRVSPSVVNIRTISTVHSRPSIFDRAFGSRSRQVPGLGSGFAIDDTGTILTNQHVVRGADQIEVIDIDGQRYEAKLVGSDALTDLAVVQIPAGLVPAAPLGTSSDLVVGEPAVALGNPSGFSLQNSEATVTSGVISGVGRDIQSQSGQDVLYADMIQTDASINPGNSGGPLANAEGNVIGVNSSILSHSGGSEGLGFAIPIDRALRVANELADFGRVRRPWVGAAVITDRSDVESMFGRPVVAEVYPGTPADAAGLQVADEITSLNGRAVNHDLDWQVGLVDAGVGNNVEVTYRRGQREQQTQLFIEEIPSGQATLVEVLSGLGLVTVTEQIIQERSLEVEFGALIVSIEEEVQRVTRLRIGDVIWGINENEVRSAEEASEFFDYYAQSGETQGWVRVHIARGKQSGALTFRVG